MWQGNEKKLIKGDNTFLSDLVSSATDETNGNRDKLISADVFWSPSRDSSSYSYFEDILEGAPQRNIDICTSSNVKIVGVGTVKLASDSFFKDETSFTSIVLEDPTKSAISYNPGKFYDPSLGSFKNSTEDLDYFTAQYPYVKDKCQGVGIFHYTVSGEEYRKDESNGRPVRKHALDHSFEYIDQMGLLFFGYVAHPWSEAYTNHNGEDDDGNCLVDTDWDHYSHPQWARVYAKKIISSLNDNNPDNTQGDKKGVFKHTKLITVNNDLIIHDGQDEILKIQNDKIIIENADMISSKHELDFYTPNCCWSSDVSSEYNGYGNVALGECEKCYSWLSDSVDRTREGYTKYKYDLIQTYFTDTNEWLTPISEGDYSSPCTDPSNRDTSLDVYDSDGNITHAGPLIELYRIINHDSYENDAHSCWEVTKTSVSPDNTYGYAAEIFRAKS